MQTLVFSEMRDVVFSALYFELHNCLFSKNLNSRLALIKQVLLRKGSILFMSSFDSTIKVGLPSSTHRLTIEFRILGKYWCWFGNLLRDSSFDIYDKGLLTISQR